MRRSILALSRIVSVHGLVAIAPFVAACSQPAEQVKPTPGDECILQQTTFEAGDPNGHADPFGADAEAAPGCLHAAHRGGQESDSTALGGGELSLLPYPERLPGGDRSRNLT